MRARIVFACAVVISTTSLSASKAWSQAPTIEPGLPSSPGSGTSPLGRIPGSGGGTYANQPGTTQDTLGGRAGPSVPRVPPSITMPGGVYTGTQERGGMRLPSPLTAAELPVYGTLDFPTVAEDEGPLDGLTLDQAIERLVRENLDLKGKFFEIPQAQADILTASLRANPIFFADAQLVPYGQYTRERPGGQTQYDVNISYPLDLSRKRRARTVVATRAKHVLEAMYQDAVRLQIGNLYTAYVDVLAARKEMSYRQASVDGLDHILKPLRDKLSQGAIAPSVVDRAIIQREAAAIGLADAQAALGKTRQTLAAMLNVAPEHADQIELRGSLTNSGPEPPQGDELVRVALETRPDLQAFRLGITRAEADVKLALANRYQDVYALIQPYTLQDNSPLGLKSPTSWALGITVPLPLYNRNQGNIQRARINVSQSQTELLAQMRVVVNEVRNAEKEYLVTQAATNRIESVLTPAARSVLGRSRDRYEKGLDDVITFLNNRQEYNAVVKQYLDTLVRRRRAALDLNTAVGQRLIQ